MSRWEPPVYAPLESWSPWPSPDLPWLLVVGQVPPPPPPPPPFRLGPWLTSVLSSAVKVPSPAPNAVFSLVPLTSREPTSSLLSSSQSPTVSEVSQPSATLDAALTVKFPAPSPFAR